MSWETGNIKPINTGVKQNAKAKNDLMPLISFSVIGLKFDASCVKADLALENLSEMKRIAITNNNIDDSCIADCKSYIPCHVLKIPVVKVGTAKCSTAPKSESVSIEIKAKPAIIAGLIIGNETRKNR